MTRAGVRQLLNAWPLVLRLATDPLAKEFADSVWKQAGNDERWMPSRKQLSIMRTMVRQAEAQREDDVVLIED